MHVHVCKVCKIRRNRVEVVGGVVEIDMRSGDCLNDYIYTFSQKGATWHLCESSCRQRRTARRLGADHHRLQSAAPPDGRRRPAASRTRQSDRPQMLIHHCVQQIHFCKMTVLHRCQHFLHQRMSCNSAFSQRAIPEYFNDPPAFFPSPIALPMACFLLSTA